MFTAISLVLFVILPLLWARAVADKQDRFLVSQLFGVSALAFLAVLLLIAESVPFAGGFDDRDYYQASVREFKSFSEWFDLSQFKDTHEQAGYPMLLAWIHQMSGGSLFVRKSLNVFFFMLLAANWFAIGKIIGGRRLAFVYAVGILLCTPLWYYWMFLFKDMTIVLLQSWFLLGVVLILTKGHRMRGFRVVVLSTVAVIPFRSILALVNIAVLGMATVLEPSRKRSGGRLLAKILIFGSVAIGVIAVGSRPDLLASLGVESNKRLLQREALEQSLAFHEAIRPEYFSNPLKFSLVYLVGEVTAFNPSAWGGAGFLLTRAGTAVPWAYFGLPLFLVGIREALRKRNKVEKAAGKRPVPPKSEEELSEAPVAPQGSAAESRRTGRPASTGSVMPDRAYLLLFLGFVLLYMAVSWVSGDTTRWRMASFPPMVALAGVGWLALERKGRSTVLILWAWGLSMVLLGYYVFLK